METLHVTIPAYNEQDNIDQVIEDWYPVVERVGGGSRLVVIDDGSSDNTYQALLDRASTRPRLVALTKPNGGHGPTVLYGYHYALEQGATYVFQTDSDGQTLASEFWDFWDLRHEFDAILGNRAHRQDGLPRKLVENVLCLVLRLTFGVSVPDANAPFRLMSSELLGRYLPRLPDDFNLPNAMLCAYFAYFHERIAFREVTFRSRQAGKNSINIRRIMRIGWKAVGDFRELRRHLND